MISPYFPEYKVWIENAGCNCIEVPARRDDFQMNIEAIEDAITPKTKAIVINSPNNPVGSVYPECDLIELANALRRKQDEFGITIYIIADEPYREIVYGNVRVPFVPPIYENTLVCYSYSKSLSLPGERIGYILVPNTMPDWNAPSTPCAARAARLASCAPRRFCSTSSSAASTSRAMLRPMRRTAKPCMAALRNSATSALRPKAHSTWWVRALEPDAQAFAEAAKAHELLLVPSNSFGVEGWLRVSYCVAHETIVNSMPAFAELMREYQTR